MSLTFTIADFLANIRFADLPGRTVEQAKLALLDWLGVTLAGSLEASSILFRETLAEFAGPAQADILGQSTKADIFSAALANGYASHVLDYDDIHLGMIGHPSVPVFPAIVALGQWKKSSGRDLIRAFAAGVELESRLGAAVNPEHYDHGWHSTATLGYFGAAAGAGALLGLDPRTMVHALGAAGTQASGLRQVFGTMCKPFHPARAAAGGLMAAVLASRGFTSSGDIIAGENGFGPVLSEKFDPLPLTAGLGESWAVDEIIIKRHASCYRTHAVIECGLALRKSVLPHVDQIASVKCVIPPLAWDMSHILDPQNGLEGKFSQPFCTAAALVEGQATNQVFNLEKIKDPVIAGLIKKTTVQVDPALESTEARVEIALKDGRTFCEQKDTEKLGLTPQQIMYGLKVKFTSLLKGHAPDESIQVLIKSVLELDAADNIELIIAKLPRMNL